jgi:alkylation response protein AidB-like acyl-CoA dehydrogenase
VHFEYSDEQEAFRAELREFLAGRLPDWWRGIFGSEAERAMPVTRAICGELAERGWLTMAWPTEFGGSDGDLWSQMIVREEMWGHGEPRGPQYMNLNYIGPMIMEFGTDEQRERFLPPMAAGTVMWTQGFSEPEAGSDLASLRTRAEDHGDHFVVTGQKIWNTYASAPADWCLLLVRTDPDAPKHKGLSVLLVDMTSPGVTVRPIEAMAGWGEINEIFLDDVVVPKANLLGAQNGGWPLILYGLKYERTGIALHGRALATIERLVEYARSTVVDGRPLSEDPFVRTSIAELYCRYRAARLISYRVTSMVEAGEEPLAEAPMAWIHGSLVLQATANAGLELLGAAGQLLESDPDAPVEGRIEREWVETLPMSIAPGTVDIQRSIIAQHGLGLPKAG